MKNVLINVFTERELEIIKYVINGFTNNEIATELCITTHTVKYHLENIFRKTNTHNRVQLVIYALRNLEITKKIL